MPRRRQTPPERTWPVLRLCCLLLAAVAAGDAAGQSWTRRPSGPWLERPLAVLQGLDKITARIMTFEVAVGGVGRFGTLEITVRACRRRPPTEAPESAAFLEIIDHRPGGTPVDLFAGWMFASSPALNALEHPVYDVWVTDCSKASTRSPSSGSQ